MDNDEKRDFLKNVSSRIRVTKVVATRSFKGRRGDNYVGFSAGWDSTQDDAGGEPEGGVNQADDVQSGMTIKEAKVASLILGMQADIAVLDNALAGSSITQGECETARRGIKSNYNVLISRALDS